MPVTQEEIDAKMASMTRGKVNDELREEIREKFVNSDLNMSQLAEHFKVAPGTISRVLKGS